MKRLVRCMAMMAAALLVAGCVTRPAPPIAAPLEAAAQLALLQGLDRIELGGRVAGAVGSEGFSAQLDLRLRGQRANLALRAPLGFGSATVEVDGDSIAFSSSRGERLSGPAAQSAVTQRLGFEPPVRSLRYWLLGVPDPASPSQPTAATDGSRAFEQDGWRITATDLSTARTDSPVAMLQVPRRVTLERPPVRLRVLIERWKLAS